MLTAAQYFALLVALLIFCLVYIGFLCWKVDRLEKENDYYKQNMSEIHRIVNEVKLNRELFYEWNEPLFQKIRILTFPKRYVENHSPADF